MITVWHSRSGVSVNGKLALPERWNIRIEGTFRNDELVPAAHTEHLNVHVSYYWMSR